MYSLTFYPDPTGGGNSMDGWAAMDTMGGAGITWTAARDGAGDNSWYSALGTGSGLFVRINGSNNNVAQRFSFFGRTIVMFDTSILGDSINIVSSTLSLWLVAKLDELSIGMDACVVSSNPSAVDSISNSDYTTLGTTPLSNIVDYATFTNSAYNDFTLNSGGISAISLTGTTKLGLINKNYDIDNSEPTCAASLSTRVNGFQFVPSQNTGTTQDPKLVVNFRPQNNAVTIY